MNISVSNLGNKVTEESLHAVFSTYGKVSSSRVLPGTDGAGMAFVEMPDEKEALTAIKKINGKIIGGTAIMVEGR
jgi:RNA recognition motif-containing protein